MGILYDSILYFSFGPSYLLLCQGGRDGEGDAPVCRVVHRKIRQASDDLHKLGFPDKYRSKPDPTIYICEIRIPEYFGLDLVPDGVVDPGCLPRIPDFFHPGSEDSHIHHPRSRGQKGTGSQIRHTGKFRVQIFFFVGVKVYGTAFSVSKTENIAFLSSKPAYTYYTRYLHIFCNGL